MDVHRSFVFHQVINLHILHMQWSYIKAINAGTAANCLDKHNLPSQIECAKLVYLNMYHGSDALNRELQRLGVVKVLLSSWLIYR
jgi:hypothetical protein